MEVLRKSLQICARRYCLPEYFCHNRLNFKGLPTTTTFIRGKADIGQTRPVLNQRELKLVENDDEKSWVKKFLYGSGPSADVEPDTDEIVEIEARYMEVLKESKQKVIEVTEETKPVYTPPADVKERIQVIATDICQHLNAETWKSQSLEDNLTKFKILSRCNTSFKHCVPNYLLSQMKTVDDVINFYTVEVKDSSKFDELSSMELPPNLNIHWDYKDDSKLEMLQEHLEYIKPKERRHSPRAVYVTSEIKEEKMKDY
ncbi:uncharacterized protein [Antedon mediterranea]|uniref:uncharacterized protein n=1 Tax=Antedon mediterranea TaxID=105859 RepID=UPI003AF64320